MRWRAARLTQRFLTIISDIQAIRPSLASTDGPLWPRLLLTAARQIVWTPGTEWDAVRHFCREAEERSRGHLDLSEELAQLDFLQEVAAGWRALRLDGRRGAALRRVLPFTWDEPASEWTALFQAYLEEVAHPPADALALFDHLHSQAPAVLGHLINLLARRHSECFGPPVPHSPTAVLRIVGPFLARRSWWNYPWIRRDLLELCLAEAIAPEALAQAIADRPELAITKSEHLASAIAGDWPLRSAFMACEQVAAWPVVV
jgi:hypothetical protein